MQGIGPDDGGADGGVILDGGSTDAPSTICWRTDGTQVLSVSGDCRFMGMWNERPRECALMDGTWAFVRSDMTCDEYRDQLPLSERTQESRMSTEPESPRSDPPSVTSHRNNSGLGGPVYVHGYYRRNGTYVHPYTRRR